MSGKLTGQSAMSKLVDLYAAAKVGEQQMLKNARDAQHAELGVNSTARVTALNTFLDANGLSDLKPMMVTAKIVRALETWALKTAGGGNFSQQHRDTETAQKVSDDEWAKMSPSEKRAYAAQFPQPVQNGRAA